MKQGEDCKEYLYVNLHWYMPFFKYLYIDLLYQRQSLCQTIYS